MSVAMGILNYEPCHIKDASEESKSCVCNKHFICTKAFTQRNTAEN